MVGGSQIYMSPPCFVAAEAYTVRIMIKIRCILNHRLRLVLICHIMSAIVFSLNAEVLPEQTDGDPAGPEDVRVLQATRGDGRTKDE